MFLTKRCLEKECDGKSTLGENPSDSGIPAKGFFVSFRFLHSVGGSGKETMSLGRVPSLVFMPFVGCSIRFVRPRVVCIAYCIQNASIHSDM